MLRPHCKNVIILIGTVSTKEKRLAMERLESIPADESMVIVATGRFVGEGFNYPRLDTLFIALPVAYPNIVQQYTGRLHRDYEGKTEVRVYDYIDIHLPSLANMYGKRLKCYALSDMHSRCQMRWSRIPRTLFSDLRIILRPWWRMLSQQSHR